MTLGLNGWLEKLADKKIPVLKHRRDQALEVLNDESQSASDCRSIILSDPGMAANLLWLMNNERLKAKRMPITTVSSLISLFGVSRLLNEIQSMTCIEDLDLSEANLTGVQRCLKQSWYCVQFAMRWALDRDVREPEEINLAASLQCLPELMLWCYGDDSMSEIEHLAYCECKDYFEEVTTVLGCHKREIGAALAEKWCLPEVAGFGFETEYNSYTNGTAVGLAALLARLCLHGWYGSDMAFFLQKAMHYFGEDEIKTIKHIHQHALDMAVDELEAGYRPVASLLLNTNLERISEKQYCLPDATPAVVEKAVPKDESVAEKKEKVSVIDQEKFSSNIEQLKTLVKEKASLNELIKQVVLGLHDAAGFNRVSFLVVTADKKKLEAKINKGPDDSEASLKQLKIALIGKDLFSLVLKKPQVFWLNKTNYEKYWGAVSGHTKTALQVDSFCIASIYFGTKPLGMIYADNLNQVTEPEKFKAFQQMCMMLNKGLELMAKAKK